MKLLDVLERYSDTRNVIQLMRRDGLLARSMKCPNCNDDMTEAKKPCVDGLVWRCNRRSCRIMRSIRVGTFFARSHLPLGKQMLFMHLWSKGYSAALMEAEFGFSKPTIVDWSRFCRDICLWHVETDLENAKIGGPDRIVEIDKSLIVRRKYNRGRMLSQEWVFGGIERCEDGTWGCFVEFVADRSTGTLTEIIKRRIAPKTHIISDGWAAYSALEDLDGCFYKHSVVNHSENFVDPADASVHTQRIENCWMHLKRFLRSKGTNRGPHNWEYVCEFLF
jgi:hypothetical protein